MSRFFCTIYRDQRLTYIDKSAKNFSLKRKKNIYIYIFFYLYIFL